MTDAPQTPPPQEKPPVETHLPKPARNWRGYLREVGIVVLGVGLALGAQQVADWWRWKSEVAQAREVIATELTTIMVGAIYRMRDHACTGRRLDELALTLEETEKKGALPPLGDIGSPWRQTWPRGVWESIVASQTAAHFPRNELANLANTYKLVERLEEYSVRDVEGWNVLFSMVGPGRHLAPASIDRLREALSQVRTSNNILYSQSIQLVESVTKLPLSLDRDNQDRIAVAQNRPLTDIFVCNPIGATPASYGQGYINPVMLAPGRRNAAMKSLGDFLRDTR